MNSQKHIKKRFDGVDEAIASRMDRYGLFLLRISLGIIYIWFGLLKPLGMSPAENLVENTIYWFDASLAVPLIGWWEVLIGVCLLFRPLIRAAIFLLALQMVGTFLPLVILPDICFTNFPFGLTLEGQYIIKNLIIISAAIVIGGTVRKPSKNKKL